MSNTSIQLKKSGAIGNTPSGLAFGEVAINYADGKLYYKNSLGVTSYISNQFSFDTINANNSLILATGVSDTLSFVAGNNITISTNTTTKTITINSSGGSTDQFARDAANSAGSYANAAFEAANSGGSSTDQTARNIANASFTQANAAFELANNALPTSGGTISGSLTVTQDVSITGNLVVLGNTTSINTNSFTVEDTLLTLGLGNYTSDLLDIGFSSHYNDGTNAHTGLIRDASEKSWMFFEGYTPEVSPNNNIVITDPSFRYANLRARDITGNLIANTVTINGFDVFNYITNAYTQANTATNNAAGASLYANGAFAQANAAFTRANSVTGGFRANTVIIANSTGYLSNSNAEFSLANNTLYVQNASATNTVFANSITFNDGTKLISANGIVASTAANAVTANVAVNARITNVTTGTYFPIVTDTTITGADTFHYSSNDFLMYAANNTFRATGNLWAGQFITVGSNIPVVNATGHWVGQPLVANNSSTANVSNVAINARITVVNTGIYYPIVTDTTVTGSDTLHYSSNDFVMFASNNTFRATGNLWAGQFITVGSNVPVVNSTGHWVGQTLTTATDETARSTANSAGSYANAAFLQANAAFAAANAGGAGTDQYARDTANAAFIQANAAFIQANTGGGGGGGVSNNGSTLSGTITPLANTSEQFNILGITGDITIAAPAGTPSDGQKLIIRIKDAGTSVNISWNVIYRTIVTSLPTSTVPNKTAYVGFIYNTADTDWDAVAISLEN